MRCFELRLNILIENVHYARKGLCIASYKEDHRAPTPMHTSVGLLRAPVLISSSCYSVVCRVCILIIPHGPMETRDDARRRLEQRKRSGDSDDRDGNAFGVGDDGSNDDGGPRHLAWHTGIWRGVAHGGGADGAASESCAYSTASARGGQHALPKRRRSARIAKLARVSCVF